MLHSNHFILYFYFLAAKKDGIRKFRFWIILKLKNKRKNQFVTRQEYFKYRVQIRANEFPLFHLSGRLFQEWMVEMFMAWEDEHLDCLRKNQHKLRSDTL